MTREERDLLSQYLAAAAAQKREAHEQGRLDKEAIHDAQIDLLLHLILIFKLEG